MKVEQTLAELVSLDSVSARSNVEIVSYLAARAESMGLCARMFPYTDEAGVKKFNLVCVPPSVNADKMRVELALVGHTDTVPYDAAWAEALALTEREGKLYGRGACDTKGFIAAALTAVGQIELASLRRPLALVFTADEEVGCLGAKRLAESGAFAARYAVVGEPTSLQPMRAGKGYCLAEVRVGGREGHSAYPALGASAIFRAARLIARIERVAEALQDAPHAAFDPPYTTLNVGVIRGGTAKNIIAGECRFTLEWRPVPGQAASHAVELIQSEVEKLRAAEPDFDCHIEVLRLDEASETDADSPLVRELESLTGKDAGTVAFGTEAPQLTAMGAQAVVFGPGSIRTAHRTGEFVPTAELEACVEILARAIGKFCQ
ncbi:MAG: acetylornithine deacetylase [Pyrinomonadaceae bacterium]|jgi:acetylornithine deacetylase|nr:acetylornithine deacetylase [Pyrinomonadaceae bacterium]